MQAAVGDVGMRIERQEALLGLLLAHSQRHKLAHASRAVPAPTHGMQQQQQLLLLQLEEERRQRERLQGV